MSLIPWLEDLNFPPASEALDDPNGLLAAGGDLSPQRLLLAYRQGIFPWFDDDQPILWWSPNPRAVLYPADVHISRSLAKRLRRKDFTFTFDTHFDAVVEACAAPRSGSHGTWITDEMAHAYSQLHHLGYAHSLEVWLGDTLVGGLYGISLGKLFFGESMFSTVSDASKAAFVALARQCQAWDFPLIDCQIANPHLSSMGAIDISRQAFLDILDNHAELPHPLGPWQFSIDTGALV
ncbi:MAG: hypothetical protein RL336_768 [Pseudomonadota bacterium]|jgi:leucyl/phenylalanyl-tRNA--protein transferase